MVERSGGLRSIPFLARSYIAALRPASESCLELLGELEISPFGPLRCRQRTPIARDDAASQTRTTASDSTLLVINLISASLHLIEPQMLQQRPSAFPQISPLVRTEHPVTPSIMTEPRKNVTTANSNAKYLRSCDSYFTICKFNWISTWH